MRVYRVVAGAAHRLRITAVAVRSHAEPVADTAAGVVAVAYHPPAGRRRTVELLDPSTGAVLRRLGEGFPMGAAGHVLLVSLHGCNAPPTHGPCTLESVNLPTGAANSHSRVAGRAGPDLG